MGDLGLTTTSFSVATADVSKPSSTYPRILSPAKSLLRERERERERERFVFRQLDLGKGIRRPSLKDDDMSLLLRSASLYADLPRVCW